MRRNKVAISVEALGTVNLSKSRADAYEAVRLFPAQTALELEEITGTRLIQRRLSELEELGLLICAAPRVCVVSGRRAHTYSINPKALRVKAMCAEGLPSSVIRERLGVSKEFIRRIARGLS